MTNELGSYGRFSSKPQEKGDSIRRQEAAYERIWERYGKSKNLFRSKRFAPGVLFDKGVSSFHGKHATEGDLGRFLDMIKSGEIKPGFVLAIETFDRFSRQEPDLSMRMLSDIVRSGIDLVFDSPDLWISKPDLGGWKFLIISTMLQLAHAESKQKSERKLASEGAKDEIRKATKKPALNTKKNAGHVSACCPSWLSVTDYGYQYNSKADTLKEAIRLSINGLGCTEIRRKLKLEGQTEWQGLTSIFRSKALIGTMVKKNGVECPGNYPALIDLKTWYALQAALDSRAKMKARKGKCVTNLFTNLLFDSIDGQPLIIKRERKATLINAGHLKKVPGANPLRIGYQDVEDFILGHYLKLRPEDLKEKKPANDELEKLEGRLADKEARLKSIQARLATEDGKESEFLINSGLALEQEKKAILAQIHELKKESLATPSATTLEDSQDLIAHLRTLSGQDLLEARSKLKSLIAGLVERLEVYRWDDCFEIAMKLIGYPVMVLTDRGGRISGHMLSKIA